MTDRLFDGLGQGQRVVIVHAAGRTCRAEAGELRQQFALVGIEAECVPARNASIAPAPPVTLVVGVDATAAACRIAVEHEATLVVADNPGREILRAVVERRASATAQTSPLAVIVLDDASHHLITHRAVISSERALDLTDGERTAISLATATQVAIDIPQILPHGPGHDRRRPGPRAILVTSRSESEEDHLLLHPDDRCVVTAPVPDGLHIHVDATRHLRATSVMIAPHPVGVRVLALTDPATGRDGRTVA